MNIKDLTMKTILYTSALFMTGCLSIDSHKANILERKINNACELQAACTVEQYDDSDYYDLDDEEAFTKYTVESCIDSYHDTLYEASYIDCGMEYRAFATCMAENYINQCDYDLTDSDDYEDYYDDMQEVQSETCWVSYAAYVDCN